MIKLRIFSNLAHVESANASAKLTDENFVWLDSNESEELNNISGHCPVEVHHPYLS